MARDNGLLPHIKLNAKVTEINHSTSSEVVVSYTQGGKMKKVRAKSAAVTVSLNVLKASLDGDAINFVPALPWRKQNIIRAMDMDVSIALVESSLQFKPPCRCAVELC